MSVTKDADKQWLAAGSLLGRGMSSAVGVVADTHRVIADRVERWTPQPLATVPRLHHAAAQTTYSTLAALTRHAPVAAAKVGVAAAGGDIRPVSQTAVGRPALRWANGILGDRLTDDHPELAFDMAVRVDDHDVPGDRAAAAFPDATGRLAVFLHGLTETEECWTRGLPPQRQYPVRLRQDLGFTPVLVRYNSGLHISENGRLLDELLEEVVAAWPVPIESLVIVGHSMGGLVARSACITASDRQWLSALRTVITLGTPHLGSPVEKLAHVADWMMKRIPDAEPTGRILGLRSVGIRDLRYGSVTDGTWADERLLVDPCADIPGAPGVSHYWVAGSLTGNGRNPISLALGDGLVRAGSAAGRGRTRSATMAGGAHVAGVHHMGLVASDEVYDLLVEWLD